MANRHRGEIAAKIDDRDCVLCLTLGALAELEDAFGVSDLNQLIERISSGRLSAREMIAIVGAGLRGAGYQMSDDEVGEIQVNGSATGYVNLVSELLAATFGNADETERVR